MRPPQLAYLTLAYGCIGLGAVGAVLPVMPTTPFLLVALWAGARSTPRLRFRLYRHPRYGSALRAWHRHGVVPPQAKAAACLALVFSGLTLWLLGMDSRALAGLTAFFLLIGGFILTRRSTPEPITPTAYECNLNH